MGRKRVAVVNLCFILKRFEEFLQLLDSCGKTSKQERYKKRCIYGTISVLNWEKMKKLSMMAVLYAKIVDNKCEQSTRTRTSNLLAHF